MKRGLIAFSLICFLAACGGGGGSSGGGILPGGGGGNPSPSPTASATATPPATSSQTATLGSSPTSFTLGPVTSITSATVTMPAVSGSASATITMSDTLPAGAPAPSVRRVHKMLHRDYLGGTVTPIAYFSIVLNAGVTISQTPGVAMTFPSGILSGYAYAAIYDPTNAAQGWNAIAGPQGPFSGSATSLSFSASPITPPVSLAPNVTYVIAIVETGNPLPTPAPSAIPTATPTATPTAVPTETPTPGASASPATGSGTPLPAVEAPQGGWSAYDVAKALAFPVQSGWNGSGQTVAIVMDQWASTSDVSSYEAALNIPQTGRSITQTPSPDGTPDPTADAGEVTLDVETVAGLAPGANIIEYGLPQLTDQAFTDTVAYVTANSTAKVISFSAGGCEYPGVTSDAVFQAAASAGIAVIASSGDQGNECFASSGYQVGVGYPASDPFVTGLGGTETTSPYPLTNDTVWNDTSCVSGQCAGGGGLSAFFTTPTYQQGLAGASQSFRNVPDVSLPAEFDAVYQGGWALVNGTSWSAPEYAALMSEIYQYCNSSLVDPVTLPYTAFSRDPAAFIDVTKGNNQYKGSTPYYTAASGFDDASGLGVPYGLPMANALCPNRVPSAQVRASSVRMTGTASSLHDGAFTVNVTPPVRGLYDAGRRTALRETRVQIAVRNDGDVSRNESAIISSLQASGFHIVLTFRNHLIIDAVAPSGIVESYFNTEVHDVVQTHYGTRYMPVRPVVVPAVIAPYVLAVNLDDVVTMHAGVNRHSMPF